MKKENTAISGADKPDSRRKFLKTAAVAGAAATLGFPHIRNAKAAATTTWRLR